MQVKKINTNHDWLHLFCRGEGPPHQFRQMATSEALLHPWVSQCLPDSPPFLLLLPFIPPHLLLSPSPPPFSLLPLCLSSFPPSSSLLFLLSFSLPPFFLPPFKCFQFILVHPEAATEPALRKNSGQPGTSVQVKTSQRTGL